MMLIAANDKDPGTSSAEGEREGGTDHHNIALGGTEFCAMKM